MRPPVKVLNALKFSEQIPLDGKLAPPNLTSRLWLDHQARFSTYPNNHG